MNDAFRAKVRASAIAAGWTFLAMIVSVMVQWSGCLLVAEGDDL